MSMFFSLTVNYILEEKRMLVFQTLAQPSWKTFLFSHQPGRGGTWGADPTHLSLLGLGGSRGVVALVSVVIPARSIPARTLPAPVFLSSPCPFTFSTPFKSWLWTTTGSLYLYPQIFHKNFIVPTFSSNSTLIWEPEEAKEFHLGEFRAGMGASGWSDPAYK